MTRVRQGNGTGFYALFLTIILVGLFTQAPRLAWIMAMILISFSTVLFSSRRRILSDAGISEAKNSTTAESDGLSPTSLLPTTPPLLSNLQYVPLDPQINQAHMAIKLIEFQPNRITSDETVISDEIIDNDVSVSTTSPLLFNLQYVPSDPLINQAYKAIRSTGFEFWPNRTTSNGRKEDIMPDTVNEKELSLIDPAQNSWLSAFQRIQPEPTSHHAYSIPKRMAPRQLASWFGLGAPVDVAGFHLPHGLVYVAQNGEITDCDEPSLIDASLCVHKSAVDITTSQMPYWPRYSAITPSARRGYLQWQAGGRCDPEVDIGYVFLFFYGLERRALLDADTEPEARQDIPIIKREVHRLLDLYGNNNSFRSYATQFIDYLNIDDVTTQIYLQPPPIDNSKPYALPMSIRIGLGQMAVDKFPLNSNWALAWVMNDPEIVRRTPVTRCREKFSRLFEQEFSHRYPKGIILKNNKTRLNIYYRSASPRLSVPKVKIDNLPDVIAIYKIRNKLQALVDHCSVILEPYSRYLRRNPDDDNDSLNALLQLPVTLWPDEARAELQIIKDIVNTEVLCIKYGVLIARFKSVDTLSRERVITFIQVLESLNIGFEPDVLSGRRTPKPEDMVALFAASPEDKMLGTDSTYNTAIVTLDLASAVAAADGRTSPEEIQLLSRHMDSWSHIAPEHHRRLNAHLAIQLKQPPTLASLEKKLAPLKPDDKRKIASFLSHLAHADGEVSSEEIKLLERIYKALSLPTQTVYSDLHSAAPNIALAPSKPFKVTSDEIAPTAKVSLDMSKIAKLQRETAEVSALLAGVFDDDDSEAHVDSLSHEIAELDEVDASIPSQDGTVYGLDIDHSAFLRWLISREQWSRTELEDVAADLDLMLDGALEQLNELAFDHFNMPLFEGDSLIEINPEILDELTL